MGLYFIYTSALGQLHSALCCLLSGTQLAEQPVMSMILCRENSAGNAHTFKLLSGSDTHNSAHISLARASHVTMPESCMVMLFNLSAKSGAVISEWLVMQRSTATLVSTEKTVRSPRAKAALRIPAPSASQFWLAQVLAQSHLRKHQPSEWLINGWMKYKWILKSHNLGLD